MLVGCDRAGSKVNPQFVHIIIYYLGCIKYIHILFTKIIEIK